jgi:hypothetical protein
MSSGVKFDAQKLKWHLVIWDFFEAVVRVLMFGAAKYSADNWKKVQNRRQRYQDAMTRHWVAYCKGERIDPETGESHLAHLGCNAMFLFWMDMTGDEGLV